ncbi:M28 family metallopeptidase [Kangiella sediminilitoris]|uniref:Peptidase M28 n=1 Tax=Kangiella sediminilitoris TaxID=1144748 RepID=A0A1B3B8Z9_9GAMM|nr:M28 family metallopeptidase [Kangiella sediminilitoris]AOE49226.1 peptidase M28 [Kangiella sediminilitoris]
MNKTTLSLSIAALLLSACNDNGSSETASEAKPAETKQQETTASKKAETDKTSTDSSKAQNSFLTAYDNIDLEQYKERVKTLSTDEFAGRSPATEGGRKTTEFLKAEFEAVGAEPGNGDSYFQQVPLISIEADANMQLQLGDSTLEYSTDFVAGTAKTVESIELKDSDLVYVGYGVVAPEYGWNDYEGIDMEGKTAVILINDPGFAQPDAGIFQGKAMTYYGRWTYKYEEAARQGAAGAIIIHETAPASYGWNVVSSSWSGPQYHLPSTGDEPKLDAEMWITFDQAHSLFKQSGLELAEMQQKALSKDFKPVPLDSKASVSISNTIKESQSANVIATIPGKKKPDEHVIYMAHWDHLGSRPNMEGDHVYNGAIDNATGTAGIISIAQAFKQLPEAPDRSVTFVAVTAEEQGLLGSKYFAANPIVPLNKIVGAFNIDSMNMSGRMKDFTVVGYPKSEVETYVEQAAKRQGRELRPESKPERGGYYRSDHFSLAKFGVPAVYGGGGTEYRDDADKAAAEKWDAMRSECYHNLCDEYQEDWVWNAAMEDIRIFFEAGYLLSNSGNYPNWYEGTEFKAIRDKSMQQTK